MDTIINLFNNDDGIDDLDVDILGTTKIIGLEIISNFYWFTNKKNISVIYKKCEKLRQSPKKMRIRNDDEGEPENIDRYYSSRANINARSC